MYLTEFYLTSIKYLEDHLPTEDIQPMVLLLIAVITDRIVA